MGEGAKNLSASLFLESLSLAFHERNLFNKNLPLFYHIKFVFSNCKIGLYRIVTRLDVSVKGFNSMLRTSRMLTMRGRMLLLGKK